MNKKLLAIAVGAAMVAGATAATAGDEPTFYGKIHMSVDSMDNGTDDGTFVSSNSSRLGIKGKVALSDGLDAIYKYEMSTDYAVSGLAGDRNAWAGLSFGGNHSIVAGRNDMPFKSVGRSVDLFGDAIGDSRAVLRGDQTGDDWADRRNDVLMYNGKFGPVALNVTYGSPEGVDDETDTGISVTYKAGPLMVAAVTESHAYATDNATGSALAGSYAFGDFKVLASYGTIKNAGGSTADANQLTGYSLGASMKVGGMNTIKAQYVFSDTDADDTDATMMAIGFDHGFSKATSVYAQYATIATGDARSEGFDKTGHAATVGAGAAGDSASGFSVGMIHKF